MSSPKIYRPPLVRQLLPWLFVLVFLVTAPLLIFYTSGYRYNLKKGLIERNGTLIIDSTPSGGTLFVDSRPTGERTPITLQNMVPGWHTIRIERPNYSSWQENVLIRSERVTFANHIWLWRISQPRLVWSGRPQSLQADRLREHALLSHEIDGSMRWQVWTPNVPSSSSFALTQAATSSAFQTRWRSDGQAAIIEEPLSGKTWWIHTLKGRESAELLTKGTYHWSETDLIGNTEKSTIRLNTNEQRFVRTPHKTGVFEQSQGLELQALTTSSEQRILVDDSFLTRRFALPPGNWSFGEIQRPFVLLRDLDRWLAVQIKFGQPYAETVRGDYPRWATRQDPPKALFLQGNEIWMWAMGSSPTLLWRQSAPLVQVAWHRSGDYVFVADQKQLFVLSVIDGADQVVTALASFENIVDLTVIGRSLYVAGEKDRSSGIWELLVE